MKGVVDFRFENIKEGNEIASSEVTLDNGKTWLKITDFISKLSEWETPIMFVRQLNYTFTFLEEELLKQGYQCKYCQDKGKGFHTYTCKLKENTYAPVIFDSGGKKCLSVRFANFKMYDAEKWLGNAGMRDPFKLLKEEHYKALLELSNRKYLMTTPAKEAWRDMVFLPLSSRVKEDVYKNIELGLQGGIIEGIPSFYKIAYHYDITSMYPYILSVIDFFPNLEFAEYIAEPEKPDHSRYAYWIYPEMHCNTWTTDDIPVGSIKAPLISINRYKDRGLELYLDKRDAVKGTLKYNIAKLKVNSFIGRIIKKHSHSDFYPYMTSDEDKVTTPIKAVRDKQLGEYTYLIAKSRQYLLEIFHAAEEVVPNIHFLQINTDGFFTNKPIPYDNEKFLGSLRQEYVAHNLHIFSCNQYACDEETCIVGLPAGYYVPGQNKYSILGFIWDKQKKKYVYKYRKLTLGEDHYE